MEKLLPDVLKELWQTVDEKRFTGEQFYFEQERLLDGYRDAWRQALILEGSQNLKESLLGELGAHLGRKDMAEIERRGQNAMTAAKYDWERKVDPSKRPTVERYYEESEAIVYELAYWHTLEWDTSPLAYVTALQFARQRGCRTYLDFGAGIGSGGILFARHGFQVTLADISSPLLRFSEWRFRRRGLPAQFIDLKSHPVPRSAFDIITAMDVFEHLFDPASAAEELCESLKPGGFLFGRFGTEIDEDQP
ncbi:MAG TPA: class I SAM-dependent methyltransferase, partial [Myxococcaceae bacterium]|nr:class I SAM-dependent methyltransferase [Myxococcaceae bacterium]